MPPKKDIKTDQSVATQSDDSGIYAEYFRLTSEYQAKYGDKMVVLLQVGSFFEVYGMKDSETNIITGSAISQFCQMCQLVMSERTYKYQNNTIIMAGFRDYALEKYIPKITENGYTAVVYVQEKEGKKVNRVFHAVYSAGTYLPYESDVSAKTSNNIMCVWVDQYKSLSKKNEMTCGIAVSNIFTGKSAIYEYNTGWMLNPTTFDNVERFISMYSPSELLFVSRFNEPTQNAVLQYSGAGRIPVIHTISADSESARNCETQKYVNHILSSHFGNDVYNVCSEFSLNTIATQAFCYLLNFVQEHNPNLVRKISIPEFDGTTDNRVHLVNHTLKQLNIIDDASIDSKRSGQYSSVLSLLNKCCTSMGRRLFESHLLAPSYNIAWLKNEYLMISHMLKKENIDMISSLRTLLRNVADIEKICRQLVLRRIYPYTLYQLYKSVDCVQQLNMCLYESPELAAYLGQSPENMNEICLDILHTLDQTLIINECASIQSTTNFPQCCIQDHVSEELDGLMRERGTKLRIYNAIMDALNGLIQKHGRLSYTVDYVKEHETGKQGLSLEITNNRGQLLKAALDWLKTQDTPFLQIRVDDVCETIHARDIKVVKSTTKNDEIECPLLTKITRDLLHTKDTLNTLMCRIYSDFVVKFEETHLDHLERVAQYVAKMDVLFCKAYVADKYNYCCPEIDENTSSEEQKNENDKSYLDAKGLRHALIEHIQQNELYVANDICIGKGEDGILLYGTNAVGKTSMIRSVGIVAIMAQAGMFVPCDSLKYRPYKSIFSRILGNDNLFKGLSTFAVEMSELRTILRHADERSLILGDELCSGTETESALSIFMAGLIHLHEKGASFLFATHFHEIVKYDEIHSLPRLAMKHLSVYFDRERDCLVYDRILKEGSGTKMYGLEVCKSLYLPEEFLEKAHQLRNKYYPESRGALQMASAAAYNAKKIRGMCEICKEHMGEEIHHLQEQKYADEKGYIGGIHKNHPANLVSICEKCHDKMHRETNSQENQEKRKMVKKKTTKGEMILIPR